MPELEIVNAYSREPVRRLPLATAADIEAMLQRAVALRDDLDGALPPWRRLEILERLAVLLAERAEPLAQLIAIEGGKPLTDARIETERAVDGVRAASAALRNMAGEEVPMGLSRASVGRFAFTTREPRGVVVAVSAFNHPLNLIVHQVVPAIAVGCPAIVKPAPPVPLCCLEFAELCAEAGLPDGWLQVAYCGNEEAEQLVTDQRVAFFSFIGSARVGWMLRSRLAPGTRCALEHGGAAPVIMLDDADHEAAVPLLAKGGYYHAGQVCVSVQRVFAERARAADLGRSLAERAQALSVGDPLSPQTDIGPLINPAEVARVDEWVREAVAGGAQLLCGGERLGETTYAATVVLDPPADSRLARAEIFGPVVSVFSCADRREAIARANSLEVAFQAAVFGRDINALLDTARRLDAAAVMVNDHTAFRVDWMPFAGRRTSGLGVGGIGHTMADMSEEKLLVMRWD